MLFFTLSIAICAAVNLVTALPSPGGALEARQNDCTKPWETTPVASDTVTNLTAIDNDGFGEKDPI